MGGPLPVLAGQWQDGVVSQSTGASRVSGQFAFELQGLCMTRDMLAERLGPVSRGEGVSVSVWLPQAMSNAEKFPDGRDLVEVDGFIVQVDVLQSPPLTLPGQAPALDATDRQTAGLQGQLAKIASETARDFLTWVRLDLRQYWISPDGPPRPHETLLWDTESEGIIGRHKRPEGTPGAFTLLADVPGAGVPLSVPSVGVALDSALAGQATGLPEQLLSSALSKLWAGYPDAQTAVFLSALACETKVKAALRTRAAAGQEPLLELIIDERRDVTSNVETYFDRLCKAVTGCSLKDSDPVLWSALKDLITMRNRIAHRGLEPDRDEAERHTQAAVRIFAWLDSLPVPGA